MRNPINTPSKFLVGLIILLLIAGCDGSLDSLADDGRADNRPAMPDLSQLRDLGELPQLPGIPEDLSQIPDLLTELELPDLSQVSDLPQLEDLPLRLAPPGGIVFNGPTERSLRPGDRLPGTDIKLTGIGDERAEFEIDGMRSERVIGDSLDYDGPWQGAEGIDYNVRMRIYRVGTNSIRAAGVHQLTISDIDPERTDERVTDRTVRLPFITSAEAGQIFSGLTYGYGGTDDRGARVTGLPEGEYPFRKVGDSLTWRGLLRSDIPAEYSLRMLPYIEGRGQVGGTVKLTLPQ